MNIFFKSIFWVAVILSGILPVFAESEEEYKCDLMMKGYEFSNNGLSEAIIKNDKEAVELFLKTDININLPDNEGYNAMDRALKVSNNETIEILALAGGESNSVKPQNAISKPQKIDIPKNQPPIQEKTADIELNKLCNLVNENKLEEVAKIAKTSPYLNELTAEGLAPLHYAIFNNSPAMVNILLNAGADVNLLTIEGITPLDIAILNEQKVLAKVLLEYGGAMSETVAVELSKFGCKTVYDENFDLYDAEYSDIFNALSKIQAKINGK